MATPTNTPATQTKALKPADEIRQNLERMKPQFAAALPSHIDPTKFLRVVQTAVATSKDIMAADRTSLFAACSKAAADGLLPDGREAALVVFNQKGGGKTVQYMPMIGGILKKIRNSGELATITSQIIYKNDPFEYFIDHEGEHFNHRPDFFAADRGEPIGAYALARTKDGAIYVEVMNKDQIFAVRDVSKAAASGPWAGDFADEMWRKSVVRRLAKRLPSSSDLDMTFRADDELYNFDQPAAETTKTPAKGKGLRVSSLMKNNQATPEPAPTPAPQEQPSAPEAEGEVIDAEYHDAPEQKVDEELPI